MRLTKLALLASILLILPAQAQQPKVRHKAPPACVNASLPYTTGELQDLYKSYNRQYWGGKLPAATVVWTALGKKFGQTTQDDNGRFIIKLDVTKNREIVVAKTTILHEMAHIKTWGDTCHVEGKPDECAHWLAEIHRIMLEGAFDDLV